MKIILVTSDLTYCPENYNDVFEYVVQNLRPHIAGVILVRINKFGILFKLPYLYFAGCKNIASALRHNLGDTSLGKKKKFLEKSEIPFISVKSINDGNSILWLQSMKPDLVLNMRARCVYKDSVLKIPRLGCVNVHHGILPFQKGLFCDLYAIGFNRETGFTIHKMSRQIDRGEILYQETIRGNKNYLEYLKEIAAKEKVSIVGFIEKIAQANSLPKSLSITGINNHANFTKTPDLKIIKKLQHKGMIL